MAHLVAGVALALHGVLALEFRTIAPAAELHLVRLHVLDVVGCGIYRTAGFEHDRIEAALTEFLGGPSAGDAGPDDDGVVSLTLLRHEPRRAGMGAAPSKRPGRISTCSTSRCTRSLVK